MTFDLAAIGAGLPFADSLPELSQALAGGVAVVQAPPGSGKTTLVPPLLGNLVAERNPRRVVVTGPRRVVVRAAARRLAQLTDTRLGEQVGFTIRGESVLRQSALVEFVTPGVLLRRLLSDPGLESTAAVILDEVHERAIETDLLLGMLAQVRQLRADLALVAMSATLDAARFAEVLGGAPVVAAEAISHPVTVDYRPGPASSDARGVTREFLDHVAVCAEQAARETSSDDVLVFLPGAREVEQVTRSLSTRLPGWDVLPLTGQLSPGEQDRVVRGRRVDEPTRVIVSTALAESALTVPGVRVVVDAGLAREPRRDRKRDLQGLVTVTESRATAEQRAGRAARQGPGHVLRLFPQHQLERMAKFATPAIDSADLTSTALTLLAWGTPGGDGLELPTRPPVASLEAAHERLLALGACERGATGLRITDLGRRLATMPVDPRLGRALLDGAPLVGVEKACESVAFIAEQVPRGDLNEALAALRRGNSPASKRLRAHADRLARHLDRHADMHADKHADKDSGVPAGHELGYIAALAYPGRIGRQSGESYLLASGTRVGGGASSEWIVAVEVARSSAKAAGSTGALLRSHVPISEQTAREAGAHLLTSEDSVIFAAGKLTARRRTALGAIVLTDTPITPTSSGARAAINHAIAATGLHALGLELDTPFRRRLAVLHRLLGAPWPAVEDQALTDDLGWLEAEIDSLAAAKTGAKTIDQALHGLLPWPQATRLDQLVPPRLTVPSGTTIRIDYPPVGEESLPVVAVKLQECFGLAQTPQLVEGRLGILFHLLSPAGRPVAVTDDLTSFWNGPYKQVRAELRGRYPKHPWPDDPWTASATARTTKRARP